MQEYTMQFEFQWKISRGQDGAIWGDYLFRFDADGSCKVYSICDRQLIGAFVLDQIARWQPHSNAVSFGPDRYAPEDEFPLLYTNLYNTYSGAEDRREGVCCVYRLMRCGTVFTTTLVQIIRIGFVEDRTLWKSLEGNGDVRPYGNFVVDADHRRFYAFVMRDREHVTRYFSFDLPAVTDGVRCDCCGAQVVTLEEADIRTMFDGEYANYLQGACCHQGILYSVEGFTVREGETAANPPRLQRIDMVRQKTLGAVDLCALGLRQEPEWIDFRQDTLYYCDCMGNLYICKIEASEN